MGLGWRCTSTAFLPQEGFKLRALMRGPNSNQARRLMGYGEKVFQGSLDDPDSLTRAMDGVYGVFTVPPVFFMESWHRGSGASIRSGQLQQPLSPTTSLQMVAVDDIGAFAALAFEHPGKWKNRAFSLAGVASSMQQIADAFSRVTARDVEYVQVSWDRFEKNMGRELTVMYHWFEEKAFRFNIERVRREYPLTHTFDRWLEACWNTAVVAARWAICISAMVFAGGARTIFNASFP